MIIQGINTTGGTLTYTAENLSIPANTTQTIPNTILSALASDPNFVADINAGNINLSDSIRTYAGGGALSFLQDSIFLLNTCDKSGNGTVTAITQAVIAVTSGSSSVTFKITGTWVGTLNLQGSIDGVNWDSVQGYAFTSGNWTNSTTTNFLVSVPCGGLSQVQLVATAWASGTATILYNSSLGINTPQVFSSSPAAFNAAVQGNVGSGNSDNGNGVKVSGVYNTTVPAFTNGQRGDLQVGPNGALIISPADGAKATYSATSAISFASATSATDIFTITGSATKTVRVIRIGFTCQQTTAAMANILFIKRSAANSGGTSAAATAVPHDSTDAAGTATVLNYTANPSSLGSAVGTVKALKILVPASATLFTNFYEYDLGVLPEKCIVLRGTSQVLAINLNSTTITGGTFTCFVEWTEE